MIDTTPALQYSSQPKMGVQLLSRMETREDLAMAYTPGIAEVCQAIQTDPKAMFSHTFRRNNLAVISDGSAVLGLGNIGHQASYPVMEGKAMLFKRFGNIDAVPIIINTQDVEEFVTTVKHIADSFGAINLEDIAAPRCFEIEELLVSELDIPVMHDDQHGTAVVTLAAVLNALKLLPHEDKDTKIVISGSGAAGMAVTKLLLSAGFTQILLLDSQGAIDISRTNLNQQKQLIAQVTNPHHEQGTLAEVIKEAGVFIGLSKPGVLTPEMIQTMRPEPIIVAMANPVPEIMPDVAKAAGAGLVATGRSDFANQVNNALAFPGIFRAAIDKRAKITESMKVAAAHAIVEYHTPQLSIDNLMPSILDEAVHRFIAQQVALVV